MRVNSVLFLIPMVSGRNSIGDDIEVEGEKRKVFGEKISIRQSEFYQAAANGFKPEIAFKIWAIEYKGEELLEYKNQKYSIIRTFEKGETIELICEGMVNNGSS